MSSEFRVVTTYGRGAASSRTRVFDWLDYCGLHPRILSYANTSNNSPSTLAKAWDSALKGEWNIQRNSLTKGGTVLISRQASPFSWGGLEKRLLRSATLGVYDFDDALFVESTSGMSHLFSKATICDKATRSADRVIAGNDVLANWAADRCSDVRVIPTCVDPDQYDTKGTYELHPRPRIVWLGSPSTEKYLLEIAEPLLEVNRKTGAELWLVSSGERDLGLLSPITVRTDWSLDAQAGLGAKVDIGIAPLTDDPFSLGKCAYKILQYGAMGLPCIGSPVGANSTVLRDLGQQAASTTDEWVDGLVSLLEAPETTRKALGETAREAVVSGFSYAAWKSRWLGAVSL